MQIADDFQIKDEVSGLSIKVVVGKKLNRLHVEHIGKPIVRNRDLFFDKDGEFDGTGSATEC